MKRVLNILLKLVLGVATLFALCIIAVYAFSGPIKNRVKQTISDQLTTPVTIADIKLSVFKDFPNITISFNKINASEGQKLTGDKLLSLQDFTVTLNPINIIKGNYQFDEITLNDGKIIAALNGDKNNYSIFKTQSQGKGKYKLVFKKITLKNIKLQYLDLKRGDTISLMINKIQLTGKFDEKEFLVNTSGDIVPLSLKMGGQTVHITKPVSFETSFKVNKPDTSYSFTQTRLKIEDFNFIVNGKITTRQRSSHCNLQLLGDNLGLQQLLHIIPAKYLENIQDYQTDGIVECRVQVMGEWGNGKMPDINAAFKVANGSLSKKGLAVHMNDIQLAGKLNYEQHGEFTISSLDISRINATVNGEKVSGSLRLANFSNPIITAKIEGTFNLAQWTGLFKLDNIETLEGLATLNLQLEGKAADFSGKTETLPALFQGTLNASNVKLAIKGTPYKYQNFSGRLYADNNVLQIDTLHGNINGNTIGITGVAHHLLDYLFGGDKKLEVDGRLYSPQLDIPKLAAMTDAGSKQQDTVGFTFPKNVTFYLKSRIDKLVFEKFEAKNITGKIALDNDALTLDNLDFDAMNGHFALSGNVFEKPGKQFIISAQLDVADVDIHQLFYQCGNFGQQAITADNLEGNLTARLQLAAPLDKHLAMDLKKLFVTSQLTISGGRLHNFSPLLELSKFINVNELQDISFEQLQNTIEIKDNKVIIPAMEIKNSALNLVAEGYTTFENYMEYKFRVRLKDVMAKKFNRAKVKQASYEEDKQGINLFVLMKGTPPDKLKVSYDSKSAIKKAKEDIKIEKNTLVNLLRDEFNIKKDGKSPDGSISSGTKKKDEENLEDWETDIPK